jgi:hypothetical protein
MIASSGKNFFGGTLPWHPHRRFSLRPLLFTVLGDNKVIPCLPQTDRSVVFVIVKLYAAKSATLYLKR